MTSTQSQTLFAQAEDYLRQAQTVLDASQYGECEKLAYQASEIIAAAYLAKFSDAAIAPSEKAFQVFVDKIWDAGTTPEAIQEIRGIVGDIVVLREAFEPKLLFETTKSAAEMILNKTLLLKNIVGCGDSPIKKGCSS